MKESNGNSPSAARIRAEIEQKMGFCPSFFLQAPESPELTEGLWRHAQAAYLDNPIPIRLKEKLFAYLSRFCTTPHCIARHCAFLLGAGRMAGGAQGEPLDADAVLELLKRPLPTDREMKARLRELVGTDGPLNDWPAEGSDLESTVLVCAVVTFLRRDGHERCEAELRRVLGTTHYNHLVMLLAFIHTAHFWTETHPDMPLEEDVQQVLKEQRTLAEWLGSYPATIAEELKRGPRETESREDGAHLRALFDSAPEAIMTISDQGSIESLNLAAEKLFGYSARDLVGQNIEILMPQRPGAFGGRYEWLATRRDGSSFPAHLTVSELKVDGRRTYAGFIRDMTEHRQLEEQFRHSQKLEALGTLTGGIAHDFGNLLTGIIGCASIAQRKVGDDSPANVYLRELCDAAKKGSGLIRQLMSFSRKQKSELAQLDLGLVVRQAESLLRRLVGDDITLTIDVAEASTIRARDGDIEQILVNLLVNARDAMPEGGRDQDRGGGNRARRSWGPGSRAPRCGTLFKAVRGGFRDRDGRGHARAGVRTVLYDEGAGSGDGARFVHGSWDYEAVGGERPTAHPAGGGGGVHVLFPRQPGVRGGETQRPGNPSGTRNRPAGRR